MDNKIYKAITDALGEILEKDRLTTENTVCVAVNTENLITKRKPSVVKKITIKREPEYHITATVTLPASTIDPGRVYLRHSLRDHIVIPGKQLKVLTVGKLSKEAIRALPKILRSNTTEGTADQLIKLNSNDLRTVTNKLIKVINPWRPSLDPMNPVTCLGYYNNKYLLIQLNEADNGK